MVRSLADRTFQLRLEQAIAVEADKNGSSEKLKRLQGLLEELKEVLADGAQTEWNEQIGERVPKWMNDSALFQQRLEIKMKVRREVIPDSEWWKVGDAARALAEATRDGADKKPTWAQVTPKLMALMKPEISKHKELFCKEATKVTDDIAFLLGIDK